MSNRNMWVIVTQGTVKNKPAQITEDSSDEFGAVYEVRLLTPISEYNDNCHTVNKNYYMRVKASNIVKYCDNAKDALLETINEKYE